ncbi:BTE binding protein 4 [Phyllosticta capitalensis]
MLSNPTSSIQQRRQMHRRQNSTPTIFEAPQVQPMPNMAQRQHFHRRGMSVDQKPQLLSPFPDRMAPPANPQGDNQVSNGTNLGQNHPQHTVQVAQQQSMAQPGPPFPHFQDPAAHLNQPHPHPHHPLSPAQPPLNQGGPHPPPPLQHGPPHHPLQPSPQQLQDLERHIRAVYGTSATVQLSVLPPQVTQSNKSSPMTPLDHLDIAPMSSSFGDPYEINLQPPAEDHGFNFSLPTHESDNGYDSSLYSSDAISPGCSPSTSPRQRAFQHHGHLAPGPQLSLSRRPSLVPMSRSSTEMDGLLSPVPMKQPMSPQVMPFAELNLDGSIEETGITAEEIQAYISEQDPDNHRWTCLFPDCGKTFGRRENIRSHVQTHLGDRQFRCNHCGKCFVRQHDLKRHAKIHTGDKPYKCPCGAGFARQDALTRHRQRGMCDGAFPGAVKKQARRGRPRKHRPEMEERLEKSSRTRKALASNYESSGSSDDSPGSSGYSPAANVNECDSARFTNLNGLHNSDIQSSFSSSFNAEAASSPFDQHLSPAAQPADDSKLDLDIADPTSTNNDDSDILQLQSSHPFDGVATPPMSPVADNDDFLNSNSPAKDSSSENMLSVPKGANARAVARASSPSKPKRTSSGRTVSNPFSTPPSSPPPMAAGGSFFADAASAGNGAFDLQPLGDPLVPVSCGGSGFGGSGEGNLGAIWDPFEEGMDSVLAGAGEIGGSAADYSWDFGEMEQ